MANPFKPVLIDEIEPVTKNISTGFIPELADSEKKISINNNDFFDTASYFYEKGKEIRGEAREQPWSLDTALPKIFSEILPYYGGAVGGIADIGGRAFKPTMEERGAVIDVPLVGLLSEFGANIGEAVAPPMSRKTAERSLARDLFALSEVALPELAAPTGLITGGIISKGVKTFGKKETKPNVINIGEDKIVVSSKPVDVTKPIKLDEAVEIIDTSHDAKIDIPKTKITSKELVGEYYDAGTDILKAAGTRRNPQVTLGEQIADILQTDLVKDTDLQSIANRYNISLTDLGNQAFGLGTSEAAKIMAVASKAARKLERLDLDTIGELPAERFGAKIHRRLKQLENIGKGLLVSPLVTFQRNFTASLIRMPMEGLDRFFDNVLARSFGDNTVDFSKTFEVISDSLWDREKSKAVLKMAEESFPEIKSKMNVSYSADIANIAAKSGGSIVDKGLASAQKGANFLNTFNSMSDSFFRRSMFTSSFAERLRKKGIDIKDVLENKQNIYQFKDDALKAADDALTFTYSKDIPDNAGIVTQAYKKWVDLVDTIPFASFIASTPFPRFTYNSLKYLHDHSPLGLMSFVESGGFKALSKGDDVARKKLSQVLGGSTMLLIGQQIADSDLIGEKWYEFIIGKDDQGRNITVDIRPYAPFSFFVLVNKVIKDYVNELPVTSEYVKEIFEGMTGMRNIPGTSFGSPVLDSVAQGLDGVDSTDGMNKFLTKTISSIIKPFLRPIKEAGDFFEQEQLQRTTVPTGSLSEDILNELKKEIPFIRKELPEAVSPTRPTTPQKLFPFARQLTGVTLIEPKTKLEKEIDRLKIRRQEVLPSSGVKEFDLKLAEELSPILYKYAEKVISSDKYKNATTNQQRLLLTKAMQRVRNVARDRTKLKNLDTFLKVRYKGLPKNQRAVIEEIPAYRKRLIELGILKD